MVLFSNGLGFSFCPDHMKTDPVSNLFCEPETGLYPFFNQLSTFLQIIEGLRQLPDQIRRVLLQEEIVKCIAIVSILITFLKRVFLFFREKEVLLGI